MTRLQRNLLALCLGLFLGGYVAASFAATTGFRYRDRCYDTSAEALEAFTYDFQHYFSGQDHELCGGPYAPVIAPNTTDVGQNATLAIKYWGVQNTTQGNLCAYTSPKFIGLPACDPETQGIAFAGTNALFLVLAFFYAAMLGFKTGYRA